MERGTTQASPSKKKKTRVSFPSNPYLGWRAMSRNRHKAPAHRDLYFAGNELLEVWYYGELFTVKEPLNPIS